MHCHSFLAGTQTTFIYIYIYDFRQKPSTTKVEKDLSLLFYSKGSCPHVEVFRFADIRKVPEGFRKLVRKLTCSLQSHCSSGRFRKVSGSLSGSLFHFCTYACSSGRFRKGSGSLSGSLFEDIDLPHSGSFRKVSGSPTGRGVEQGAIDLHLVSWTSSPVSTSSTSIALSQTLMTSYP